jgi:hypothetical protein
MLQFEVTEKDRQYGYDQAKFFADIGVNSGLTAATLGVGCPASQSSNLAAGAVTAYDALQFGNSGADILRGGYNMVQNGVTTENVTQVLTGALGFVGVFGKSCFTAGTQIVVGAEYNEELNTTVYVTVNIEDVKVGDLVYSYDTITDEVSQKEVTDVFVRTSNHINYLTIVDENGHEQIIETTDSHPFWVVTDEPDLSRAARDIVDENGVILYHENLESGQNGFWVEAKDLKEGDVFLGANGELSILVSTERVEFPEGITVYNFTVDGNHDYFVIAETDEFGQTCILVHNANGSYTITLDNGMKYHGKGGMKRAEDSAKRIEDLHSVERTNIDWTDAASTKQSFIDEAIRISKDGGVGLEHGNYNKINSPGEKFRYKTVEE